MLLVCNSACFKDFFFFFHSKKPRSNITGVNIQNKSSNENYTFDLNNMCDIHSMMLSRKWTQNITVLLKAFLFENWARNLWGVHFCVKSKRHPLCYSWYFNFLVLTATKLFRATVFSSLFAHIPFHSLSAFHTKMVKPIPPRGGPKLLHKNSGFFLFLVFYSFSVLSVWRRVFKITGK